MSKTRMPNSISTIFDFLVFREALKNIDSLTAVVPTPDPPPSLIALGFVPLGAVFLLGVTYFVKISAINKFLP